MREIKWKEILCAKKFLIVGLLICVVALSGCITLPPLVVQKEVDPSFATLGTNVVYKYTITNDGTSPIKDITLVDDRFGNIDLTQTTLDPGNSTTVTLQHTVNDTDLNNLYEGLFIVNSANASGTIIEDNGTETPTTSLPDTAAVATPVKFIQIAASNNIVKLGDEISYEITVYNPTDTYDMDNVTVNDVFDQPVDFVSSNLVPSDQNETQYTWIIDRIRPKDSITISLVIKPREQETPYTLKSCAAITNIGDQTIKEVLDDLIGSVPDIEELLPYFQDCESVTVVSKEYSSLDSFEELLRDQHKLLVSYDDLMGQTPVTREQKIEFLNSIEDLYRRQATGMDKFSVWIAENWQNLTPVEKAQISDSLEDLVRSQAKNLEAFNGNLLAWVKTFDPPYRQKFSDSLEDLLHRQVALLVKFDGLMHQDGMQTPAFVRSFEDLLRRQAQSLAGFGDLGEFTFNNTPPQEGPRIAIYKTANKNSLACGDDVTYKYTVYNNGDEDVSDIQVIDSNYGLVGTIDSLGVYQAKSIEKTVITECSQDEIYPIKVCNTATATGTASSGQTVQATSNELCIILNGPRQPSPDFVLEKTVEPTFATPSEQLVYTYTISNNGLLPITSINIVDDKLGEIATDQELQPGDSKTYTKNSFMGDNDTTNIATATGIEGEGDVQSQGPKSQIVEATATATVRLCVNPVELTGFLIQEPTTTGECGYIFETLDSSTKYQLIPEEGYEDEFLQKIDECCLFTVSGCLLDTQTNCPIGQEIIVKNIECNEPECSGDKPLEGLNGTIKLDENTGSYKLQVSTSPSGVVFDVALYNDSTPASVWNQITDNVGMRAHVVGCTNNTPGEDFPNGQGIIVQCVKILDDVTCGSISFPKASIEPKPKPIPISSPVRLTGVVVNDGGDCYHLMVGSQKVGLEKDSNTTNWNKLVNGETVTITGCSYGRPHEWSCSGSTSMTPDFSVLVRTVRPFDPPSGGELQNSSCKTCGKS